MPERRSGVGEALLEAFAAQSRADLDEVPGQIDAQRKRQPPGIDDDATAQRHRPAAAAGSGSHRDHRDTARSGEADEGGDLLDILRPGDEDPEGAG